MSMRVGLLRPFLSAGRLLVASLLVVCVSFALRGETPIAPAPAGQIAPPASDPPAPLVPLEPSDAETVFTDLFQPPPENEGPVVELPETRVIGRPDAFPANPLPNSDAISPNRIPTPLAETASSVTLITEEQIRETKQELVLDVLRGKPGVDVVQQGSKGGITSLFLRGTNSAQAKVLLDGIPINDPSNATRGFDFSSLTVDNVERIEVLRGPQSVLYGSDAIGGVVNIITKRGQGPGTARFSAMGGSYGTSREGLSVSGGDERAYYSIGGSYTNINGFSAADYRLGNPEADGYKNGSISGRFGVNPNESFNIDYVFRYSDVQTDVDNFSFVTGLPFDNLIRRNLSKQFYQRLQLQQFQLDGAIEHRVGFGHTNYDRLDTAPDAFVPPFFHGQTHTMDYLCNILLYEGNTLSGGATYYVEDASSSFQSTLEQNQRSAYVQDQILWGERIAFTAGARWDENSRAGPANTYRTTALYKHLETNTRFFGTLGTGFRAPALAENLFQFGNPNLRPETSKGWDCGLEQVLTENWTVGATYFRNDLRNLIVFDFNTFSLQNVGQARTSGVETFANWAVDDSTNVLFTYTLTDTLDYDTGRQLLRRPRDKASINLSRRFADNRAQGNLYFVYVGDRLDTRNVVLDPYITVNLSGTYDWSDRCQLFARIDNLFNEVYYEVNGYGVAGVSGYAGLNLLF